VGRADSRILLREVSARRRGCDVIRHVADIFEKESADDWDKREASELLPAEFKCEKCGAD
jgi:hypothetical protein